MTLDLLFVIPYVPTPIRVRPWNLIRHLAAQGHALTLATLWENVEECEILSQLETEGIRIIARPLTRYRRLRNTLGALPTRLPLQARYCWQPDLVADLAADLRTRHYDAIHVEHLRGAVYAQWLQQHLQAEGRAIPIVWDSVDCISYLFAQASQQSRSRKGRLVTRMELPRTRRHEAHLVRAFDMVLVTSQQDKEAFEGLLQDVGEDGSPSEPPQSAQDNIRVLPNGVDTDYFAPLTADCKANSIVVTGKMSYHANITMVMHLIQDIMPLVWQRRPSAQLWIVGKDPPKTITRLDPTWTPDRIPPSVADSTERIVVTGTVPDLRPYLQQATVAVAPVPYGAGIQNKVLEAMACGKAVVASPQAVKGLGVEAGECLITAGDAAEFAGAILDLLAADESRDRIGRAARAFVQERFSWKSSARALGDIYQHVRIARHEDP